MARNFMKTTSPRNVKFNQQFPKDFLRPYGVAAPQDIISQDDTYHRRLQPFSCEWMQRPGIAISELCDTLQSNDFQQICENFELLQDSELKQDFLPFLTDLKRLLLPFNNKESCAPPDAKTTHKNVKKIKKLVANSDSGFIKTYIENMMMTGGALYLVAVHLRVLMYVMNNLPQVASKCVRDHNLATFIANPTLKEYSKAIHSDQSNNRPSTSATPNSIRSLRSFKRSQPAEYQQTASKRKRKQKKLRRSVSSVPFADQITIAAPSSQGLSKRHSRQRSEQHHDSSDSSVTSSKVLSVSSVPSGDQITIAAPSTQGLSKKHSRQRSAQHHDSSDSSDTSSKALSIKSKRLNDLSENLTEKEI